MAARLAALRGVEAAWMQATLQEIGLAVSTARPSTRLENRSAEPKPGPIEPG